MDGVKTAEEKSGKGKSVKQKTADVNGVKTADVDGDNAKSKSVQWLQSVK